MDVRALRDAIRPEQFEHTMLCFVRAVAEDSVEASLDFGETWEKLPLSEVSSAHVAKDVALPKATYQLVRLVLTDVHPMIELAALSAQVRLMRSFGGCGQVAPQPNAQNRPPLGIVRAGFCRDLCADQSGCDYIDCLFWCAFLRD
jgi:hypothetical protein